MWMWKGLKEFIKSIFSNLASEAVTEWLKAAAAKLGRRGAAFVLTVVFVPLLTVGPYFITKIAGTPPKEETKAYAWYLMMAQEDPTPQILTGLGECYLFGRGTDPNYDQAFKTLAPVAQEGYAPAQYDLGLCYEYGYGTDIDDEKALACFRAAEEEIPDAAAHAAYYHYRGWGGLQADKNAAHELLDRAEDRGSTDALYFQALYYLYETGIDGHMDKAIAYGRKAVEEAGCEKACGPLGLCYLESDPEKAVAYFERGAAAGDDISLYQLGDYWQTRDSEKALEYFSMAAERGNADASFSLGQYNYYVVNTEAGFQKACSYYEAAQKRNCGQAVFMLARMAEYGNGCEKDLGRAYRLYNKAIALGTSNARVYLADLYSNSNADEFQDKQKALELFLELAAEGDSYSQRMAGIFYEHGTGMDEPDLEAAKDWYRKAADQGDTIATANLAWCLHCQGDYSAAYDLFNQMAQEPVCLDDAQFALGEYFFYGTGSIAQDYEQAELWYERAAGQNHPNALVQMGRIYDCGLTGEPDYPKAFRYYKQAEELGHDDGQFWTAECLIYGRGTEKDVPAALADYEKAADQGHANAQMALSDIYLYGLEGVKKDLATAASWLEKAAENGHVRAQARLGIWYYRGTMGVPKDLEEAVTWLQLAAGQGSAEGQRYLAHCYAYGQGGLPADKEKAVELYTMAAEQGDASAQYYLGMCWFNGEGVREADREKALEWFQSAADQNDPGALYMMGCYYENGWAHIAADKETAERYYKQAEENGYTL